MDRHAAEQVPRLRGAAKVAKQSLKERKTIRQVVLEGGYVERGDLTEQQLDAALDVLSMTRPLTTLETEGGLPPSGDGPRVTPKDTKQRSS